VYENCLFELFSKQECSLDFIDCLGLLIYSEEPVLQVWRFGNSVSKLCFRFFAKVLAETKNQA